MAAKAECNRADHRLSADLALQAEGGDPPLRIGLNETLIILAIVVVVCLATGYRSSHERERALAEASTSTVAEEESPSDGPALQPQTVNQLINQILYYDFESVDDVATGDFAEELGEYRVDSLLEYLRPEDCRVIQWSSDRAWVLAELGVFDPTVLEPPPVRRIQFAVKRNHGKWKVSRMIVWGDGDDSDF